MNSNLLPLSSTAPFHMMDECDFLKESLGRQNDLSKQTNELIKIFQSFNQCSHEDKINYAKKVASLGCQLSGPSNLLSTLFTTAVKETENPVVFQSISKQFQNQEIWPLESFAQMIANINHFTHINAAKTPQLLNDVKAFITSTLDFRSLLNMRVISKDFLAASKRIINLDLSFRKINDVAFKTVFSIFPDLESLSLHNALLETQESLQPLKNLHKLKILNLKNCKALGILWKIDRIMFGLSLPFLPQNNIIFNGTSSLINEIDFAFECPLLKIIELDSIQVEGVKMRHPNIKIETIDENSARVLL